MSSVRLILDGSVNWLVANVRSFGYLLPDTVELVLYLALVAYYAVQLAQQQG